MAYLLKCGNFENFIINMKLKAQRKQFKAKCLIITDMQNLANRKDQNSILLETGKLIQNL